MASNGQKSDGLNSQKGGAAEELFSLVSDRFRGSFVGSFFISLLLANYKLLIVVFGDAHVSEKLVQLHILYPGWVEWFSGFLLVPSVIVFSYVVVGPWLNAFADALSNWSKDRAKLIELKQRKKRVVSEEEIAEYYVALDGMVEAENSMRIGMRQMAEEFKVELSELARDMFNVASRFAELYITSGRFPLRRLSSGAAEDFVANGLLCPSFMIENGFPECLLSDLIDNAFRTRITNKIIDPEGFSSSGDVGALLCVGLGVCSISPHGAEWRLSKSELYVDVLMRYVD